MKIDHLLADSILDRLGYTLQDLSLDYGEVAIEHGEIAFQLWYDSLYSSCNIMGYVYQDREIYYVSGGMNHRTAQQAALELLNPTVVEDCAYAIELERSMAKEYV
jgi:hypothetical protein